MAPFIDDPMSHKRQSQLFFDTHVTIGDVTSSSAVQKPETDLASNSQVDDLGNGKHLEQQEDSEDSADSFTGTTAPSQVPADFLVTEAGTKFGSEGDPQSMPGDLDAPAESQPSQPSSNGYKESLLGTATPGTQDTTLTEYNGSLGDELRDAHCETASKQRSEFLPIDALDRIVNEKRVKEEIAKFSNKSNGASDHDVQQVLGTSTVPGQTTSRKKIFAILALIEKLDSIWDFVREGIYDAHLPFEKERAPKGRLELLRKSGTDSARRIPIRAFHGWNGAEVTNFERTQWDIHVPIFFLNTKDEPRVRHYPLQRSVVLPFVEDDEVKQGAKMGGFADVWRVKFHPSHHNHGALASGRRENPSFAIKRLHYMDKKAFYKEVQNLKRFSTRDYLHLIKLLGTYEWRQQYYLVFPWADGNLLDFWETHPEPLAPKRDISMAHWFSNQCLGLVEGMKMIHTWDTPDAGGHNDMFSFPTHQIHGLHGDLKPENILWFKQYDHNAEQRSSPMGHFKISDFGLSHFHGTKSVANIDAKEMGFSPTYRAPEKDVKKNVAQSYDVWSLACVLLEFASWYLGGYEEVKAFGQKRVKEDTQYDGGYKQDRFFNFMSVSQGVADEIQVRAQICAVEKVSVVQEFEKLYDNPYCSDYLLDFLELVRNHLLRLGPENRRNCTEIAESLQRFHANLQKDPSYGTKRVKTPPSRTPTLDSVLMEEDPSPEVKKQFRKNLPRRSTSFDRKITNNTNSIAAVLSSSPSSSHINIVSNTRRDSRLSSPERKVNFRLTKELTTVQEWPGTQSHEELEGQQHSGPGLGALALEDTEQTDKDHTSLTHNGTGLNISCGEIIHSRPMSEQNRRPSDFENTQEAPLLDKTAAGVVPTDHGLDSGSGGHEVSEENFPAKPHCATTVEEQSEGVERDDDWASQPAMDATTLPDADGLGQPGHPTAGTEGEHQDSSSNVPRALDTGEHLRVPPDGGQGRPFSESTTLQALPDDGHEDAPDRRKRNSSEGGSNGREKRAKHDGNEENVTEGGYR